MSFWIVIGDVNPISGIGQGIFIDHGGLGDGIRIEHADDGDGISIRHSADGAGIDVKHTGEGDWGRVDAKGSGDGIYVDRMLGGIGDGIKIDQWGLGNGIRIAHTDSGDAIDIYHTGGGDGLNIFHTADGDGIDIYHSGDGDGLNVFHGSTGMGNGIKVQGSGSGDGININHTGMGDAIMIEKSNPAGQGAGMADAIEIFHSGDGDGIDIYHTGNGFSTAGIKVERTQGFGPGIEVDYKGSGAGLMIGATEPQSAGSCLSIYNNNLPAGPGAAADIHAALSDGLFVLADESTGIIGSSQGTDYDEAGIRAEGWGHRDSAAALEIKNGAIRVTGANKPAGSRTKVCSFMMNPPVFASPNFMSSQQNTPEFHGDHMIAGSDTIHISNALIDANRSLVFLTIGSVANLIPIMNQPPVTVNITSQSNGEIIATVWAFGNPLDLGQVSITLNYFIINE